MTHECACLIPFAHDINLIIAAEALQAQELDRVNGELEQVKKSKQSLEEEIARLRENAQAMKSQLSHALADRDVSRGFPLTISRSLLYSTLLSL